MLYRFNKFKSVAFLEKPDILEINGYKIEYLGFCQEEFQNNAPLIFIGGAFQNFFSFKKEVQKLSQQYPIILMDLPSQGSNSQLASELEFKDFANLLKGFCDHFNLNKIIPLALSYGSATAYYFSSMYPERVEKMILGGTSSHIRPSIRKLLEESIRVLKSGDQSLFAEGAVLNLINFSKRDKTQISPRIIKGFFKNMQCLKENCIQRYIDNTSRLLNLKTLDGTPQCETLVLTGEYDSFTSPFENYLVAKMIPNSQMVLIKDADHLANLERRDTIIELYESFLTNKSLRSLEGIINIEYNNFSSYEKRLNPRKKLENVSVTLVDDNDAKLKALMEDINYFGCKLKVEDAPDSFNYNSPLSFEFNDNEDQDLQELDLNGFIFDNDLDEQTKDLISARCIFKRGSFEKAQQLENFLTS